MRQSVNPHAAFRRVAISRVAGDHGDSRADGALARRQRAGWGSLRRAASSVAISRDAGDHGGSWADGALARRRRAGWGSLRRAASSIAGEHDGSRANGAPVRCFWGDGGRLRRAASSVAASRIASEGGSMALESALIVPILLLCACLMVYGAIVLFERAQLQAASGYAAIRASLLWNGEQGGQAGEVGEAGEVGQAPQEGQAGEVGQSPKEGHAGEAGQAVQGGGLYRRTADTQADEKLGAAAGTAERYFGAISLPGFTEHGAEAASAGGPFGKTLSVSMEGDTRLPSRAVMGAFGMSSSRRSSGASKSLVPDFPEFIRNADLVVDIEEKLEDASPEFKAFADNFEAVAGKIRGFIGGLF